MIRMGKHVGDEEVVIPHHTVGKVMPQRIQGGLCELLLQHPAVEQLYTNVDGRHLGKSTPRVFLDRQRHRGVGEFQLFALLLPCSHPGSVLIA